MIIADCNGKKVTISAFLEKTKHLCGKKQFYAKDVYFKAKSWSFVKKKKKNESKCRVCSDIQRERSGVVA